MLANGLHYSSMEQPYLPNFGLHALFAPQGLSDVAFGSTTSIWHWTTNTNGEQVQVQIEVDNVTFYYENEEEEDDEVDAGLRIVVFGEDDVATPARTSGDENKARLPGWTEALCEELECSQYLSFVPTFDTPRHSMISNGLYALAVEQVLNETEQNNNSPGKDYSFQPENYPVIWTLPDLDKQINAFLTTKKPRTPPTETLWVFTFGAWDIWSLASMPLDISKPLIGPLTDHIFGRIERLYQSALDEQSVAWSDIYSDLRRSNSSATNATAGNDGELKAQTDAVRNGTGMFRVLVPNLFDPSLTPGWRNMRPTLSEVHSKAEQMRNAAALTIEWNMQLRNKMEAWVRTPDPEPEVLGLGEAPSEEEAADGAQNPAQPGSEVKFDQGVAIPPPNDSLPVPARKGVNPVIGGQNHVTPAQSTHRRQRRRRDGETSEAATVAQEAEPAAGGPAPRRQYPLRDGIIYDMPEYLMDVIVDRQFRNAGIEDAKGTGKKPTNQGFLEVWLPCIDETPAAEDVDVDVDSGEDDRSDTAYERRRSAPNIQGRTINQHRSHNTTSSGSVNVASESEGETSMMCEAPHEHLFYTPFTVSSRAIAEIAHQAADMVRRNETVRARWKTLRLPGLHGLGS
ncbi:hypothetical protein QBC46DRAFT_357343 [Diplogelasinospora grovesii]|uniref:Uncharacterized protein n=1 Tax=Diplogelasinospora grovesii TaxID=303347 RepID=A0AAN6S1Q8_9PEZI|nr:hypothetical protein QBC46DRAFT_357343 [Diplogelasinospora grovesii]